MVGAIPSLVCDLAHTEIVMKAIRCHQSHESFYPAYFGPPYVNAGNADLCRTRRIDRVGCADGYRCGADRAVSGKRASRQLACLGFSCVPYWLH